MSENIIITIKETEEPNQDETINVDQDETINVEDVLLNEIFGSKKKKRKCKIINETLIDETINDDQIKLETMFDLHNKKKKDHKKEKTFEKKTIVPNDYDPPTYAYVYLLNKLYENLTDTGVEIKHKFTLKMPIVQRLSSKKTAWINFIDCATNINREQNHLQSFLLSELSTEGNINSRGHLTIKGIYNQKNIESILRKYISSYVQCSACKSLNTIIEKNNSTRLNFLVCSQCKSNRSLQPINTDFNSSIKTSKK